MLFNEIYWKIHPDDRISAETETKNVGDIMTARSEVLDKIRRCFSIWSSDLMQNGQANRLSDNISSEDIAAGLLNPIFGFNLCNANKIHPNHKAVDLVDPDAENENGVAVQISSTNKRQKVVRTMDSFSEGVFGKRLCDRYSKLIVLILSTEKNSRTGTSWTAMRTRFRS